MTQPRPKPRRRKLIPLLVSIVAIGVLFVGVFPTRALLSQRADIADAEQRLAETTAENDALQAQVDALRTDAEIERLAREVYGLVRPGEEAYAILPAPEPPATTTTTSIP